MEKPPTAGTGLSLCVSDLCAGKTGEGSGGSLPRKARLCSAHMRCCEGNAKRLVFVRLWIDLPFLEVPPMKLADVLTTRSSTDQDLVKTKLRLLVHGPQLQAHINIWSESRLSDGIWNDLIDRLVQVVATASEIEGAIRSWCRTPCTLQGSPVTTFKTIVHGHATTVRQLADKFKSAGIYGTSKAARSDIRAVLGRPLPWVRQHWETRDLGKHLMWSTFDGGGHGPFDFKPPPHDKKADYVRGALGLPYDHVGKNILLLEYAIPSGIVPRIPTIADAYAGDALHYYFRPAPDNETLHGWTMPWNDPRAGPSRPEVVHTVISGQYLVHTPRELKP